MLAQKYFDNPEKLLPKDTKFILTTKLDGTRIVCINDISGPKFFSRQGQQIYGLDQLTDEFKILPKNYVYDGELLLDNKNNLDSKDLYRATMKIISSDSIKENVIFNCFDMMKIADFESGICRESAHDRKYKLKEILHEYKTNHIHNVDILYEGNDQSQILYWLDKITKAGGEGVMINISDAPYECKRVKTLLKVKKFQTLDAKCIDMEEGTGNFKNSLGAIKVEFLGPDEKIYTCKVGSGFKQDERAYYWNHKDKILNKIVEIGYFEMTNNQNDDNISLRFPTFKYVRNDKCEMSSY